jgi:phage-related protein
MAGNRTLKLSILGDVDNLNKSLKSATQDVDTFGDKMGKAGKVIGAAFVAAAAAAGAYAIKIGIEGVKAAIADEKAQTQLALALENATGATQAQIAATEKSILQMSLATGVADDDLRPALQRIALSTGSLTKAQDLLATALDIAAATGKPLETVANALGKAYDGNTASLGKLGIGLSAAELKTMSFEEVQSRLTDLFGGAAAANADTYSGRIARMQVAFDEAKETIGFALLPILEKVMTFINKNALPVIEAFSNAFSLKGGGLGGAITSVGNIMVSVFTPIINGLIKAFGSIKAAIGDNADTFLTFGKLIATYVAPVIGTVLGGALQVAGAIAGGVINVIAGVVKILNGLIQGAIAGINALIGAYNAIPFLPNVSKISVPKVSVPEISVPSANTSIPKIPSVPVPKLSDVGGGVASAASSGAKAASIAEDLSATPSAGNYASSGFPGSDMGMGTTINVNVSGAIDKEGTARTIIEALNSSYYRGTGGADALVAS